MFNCVIFTNDTIGETKSYKPKMTLNNTMTHPQCSHDINQLSTYWHLISAHLLDYRPYIYQFCVS